MVVWVRVMNGTVVVPVGQGQTFLVIAIGPQVRERTLAASASGDGDAANVAMVSVDGHRLHPP